MQNVDVGFVLDSSHSARFDYQKEKDFIKTLTASFKIQDDGPVAGVVTFSDRAELSIKLNDFNNRDLSGFNKAVDDIPLMSKTTRTDKALRLAKNELFTTANGAREGVPKVLIVVIDGSQTRDPSAEDPYQIADELRADGVKVLVVGISEEVSRSEMVRLAGNNEELVFKAATFDDLSASAFSASVLNTSCPGMLSHCTARAWLQMTFMRSNAYI